MKIQPVVTNCIHTSHGAFIVDFRIPYNIILIGGDAGTGKSMIYSFIEEYGTEDARIRCFNYLDCNKPYKRIIKRSKGKLFVIDNADVLLSFMNMSTDADAFAKSTRIPLRKDKFDPIRNEYSQMLRSQLERGNNGLTKTKYITFGIEAESMKHAKGMLCNTPKRQVVHE